MHIISETDCLNYMEGTLEPGEQKVVEEHLAECRECESFYRKLVRTEKLLALAQIESRSAYVVNKGQVTESLAQVLAKILDKESKQQNLSRDQIENRLDQLVAILASMCGSWTAVNILRLAADETISNLPEQLTPETWVPFLKRLKNIASVFCGDRGAKLVWEYGQL